MSAQGAHVTKQARGAAAEQRAQRVRIDGAAVVAPRLRVGVRVRVAPRVRIRVRVAPRVRVRVRVRVKGEW